MNTHSKYTKKINRNRDCTKCRKFKGFISKNYYICSAEMYEDQNGLKCHNIYDRDFLKKGACSLFVPKEIDQDDNLHDNATVECSIEEDDQSLPDKE